MREHLCVGEVGLQQLLADHVPLAGAALGVRVVLDVRDRPDGAGEYATLLGRALHHRRRQRQGPSTGAGRDQCAAAGARGRCRPARAATPEQRGARQP